MKIKITCSQRVHYSQTVEMTKAAYNKLIKTPEGTLEDEQLSPLNEILDLRDVDEGGDFEDVDINIAGA